MHFETAIFATDEVNLHNIMLPLSTLVQSMETPLSKAVESGLPYGMPANVGHDLCRPFGWSVQSGVYIAKDKSRLLGRIETPETPEEQAQLLERLDAYHLLFQAENIEPYADAIMARIGALTSVEMRLWHVEAASATGSGLAASVYPEFFSAGSEHVDRDGLVDTDYLNQRTRQLHPGVFHEPERDLLLFAHRYLRRSLSLRNRLNDYLLDSFDRASALPGVRARLKLDPDLLGHPESAKALMEFEYWHGPHYNDDIEKIPSGVSEHKNVGGDRLFSGIDKTQIWWKDPETRPAGENATRQVRTFEVEELIEDESPGLGENEFGCRYAHSEYDLTTKSISHFDGAIRAYGGDAYLERIANRIDRAGKHATYTKLFRLDGAIPVETWKRVLSDFYRGNRLIPEYLGATDEDLAQLQSTNASGEPERRLPALSAFLGLERAPTPPPDKVEVRADQSIIDEGQCVMVAEIGLGQVAAQFHSWLAPPTTATLSAKTPEANLARILLPGNPPTAQDWTAVAQPLADAIRSDAEKGLLATVALAVSWGANDVRTTLSILGAANPVANLLIESCGIVQPDGPASAWIEVFRDILLRHAPELDAPVAVPSGVATFGRMTLERDGDIEFFLGYPRDVPED
jgi:hypothetical protein